MVAKTCTLFNIVIWHLHLTYVELQVCAVAVFCSMTSYCIVCLMAAIPNLNVDDRFNLVNENNIF